MDNFAGFILIGGKSSRMGEDKFLLELNGKTFLEIAFETLQEADLEQISAVANKSEPPTLAGSFKVIKDIHLNRGALGGIHVSLVNSKKDWTIILACDYPFVSVELIRFLTKIAQTEKDFDAFAPIQKDGKIQPLCAVYKTENCRKILSEMLENKDKKYAVRDFLKQIKTRYIEFSEIENLTNAEHFFFNVNTPEDFEKAISLTIKIEKMTADEIPQVLRIQEESNLGYWSEESYINEINRHDSFSIVAKRSNQTIGFLVARLIQIETCAELYNIGVDLNFRRKKIGEKLIKSFIKHCTDNNLEKIFLEVRESNETAIGFYMKKNFTIIGRRKNFYSNPTEDAILMELKL